MDSHLQTRTLPDALDHVDAVLRGRGTELRPSPERERLTSCFAKKRYPKFFDSWAFLASEFEEAVAKIAAVAPELAGKLKPPESPNDFNVVGNCSLDLRFAADPNGADPVKNMKLRNGTRVTGA